jgi:hypothetical protein
MHQTIPQKHIGSLLEHGHHFKRPGEFRDWMEFYYGYCLFKYDFRSDEDLQRCVRHAMRDPEVRRIAKSAYVSCWVSEIKDEARMWAEHGSGEPAIRITVNADKFCDYVKTIGYHVAHDCVRYEDQFDFLFPNRQFLVRHKLTQTEDATHHFFFHKRGDYWWEQEFRLVIFSDESPTVPLIPEMIEAIRMSPLGELDSKVEEALSNVFNDTCVA